MSHQMGQQTSFKLSKFYSVALWITFLGVGGFFGLFLVWVVLDPELRQSATLPLGLLTLGGGTILYGWCLLTITREIVVTEEAIELRSKLKTRRILWAEVVEMTRSEPPALGYVIRTATGKFNVDITGIWDGAELLTHLSEFSKPSIREFPIAWVPLRDTIYSKVMASMLLLLAALPFCALFLEKDGRNPSVYAACAAAALFLTNFLVQNVRKHSLDEEGVTVPTIFGHRRMLWRDVRKVEFGGRTGSFYAGSVQRRALVFWGRGWPITLRPGTPCFHEIRAMIFTKVPPAALPLDDAPL